jgi:hypothetical protein
MRSKKALNQSLKHNLPTIKCGCGHEILLIPDLASMGKAIEEHASEHKAKYALIQEEADAVEEHLIAQAFTLIYELESISEIFRGKNLTFRAEKTR